MIPGHLRLAVLDFAKLQLHNNEAARMLGDMVRQKQMAYERTSDVLVMMDKHDMIGTHYLIYDTSKIYEPRIVGALRTTYEVRAKPMKIPLPVDNYSHALPAKSQELLREFRRRHDPTVDCNAWFVDSQFTKANSGLDLSEILQFAVTVHLRRLGYDYWVGATNEKFKASRWVQPVGYFPDGLMFDFPHPAVPHKLILMDSFNTEWMLSCWEKYQTLFESRVELVPESVKLKPLEEVVGELKMGRRRHLRVA